jgi:uncharacterized membrane protein YkvA (DUF1232 family)
MGFVDQLKQRARALKRDTLAVWFAARDPRTPWYAKALAVLVAAYAFSPIDLIPDFIPVLGYLDDLILIPAGIALVVKLIPAEVMVDARVKASLQTEKPVNWVIGALTLLVWGLAIFFVGRAITLWILKRD